MADKKYEWSTIKKDYFSSKYNTLKELAEAYNVPDTYLRKKAAKWNREKSMARKLKDELDKDRHNVPTKKKKNTKNNRNNKNVPTNVPIDVPTVPTDVPMECIPENMNMWHKRLWDKLGLIVERALDNPEDNFFTEDGRIKSKAVADISTVIEKIQKGHSETNDNKENGQLNAYVEMIAQLRASEESKGDS